MGVNQKPKTKTDLFSFLNEKYQEAIREQISKFLQDEYSYQKSGGKYGSSEIDIDLSIECKEFEIVDQSIDELSFHFLVNAHYAVYEVVLDWGGGADWCLIDGDMYDSFHVVLMGDTSTAFTHLDVLEVERLEPDDIEKIEELSFKLFIGANKMFYSELLLPDLPKDKNYLEEIANRLNDEIYYKALPEERGHPIDPCKLAKLMGLKIQKTEMNSNIVDAQIFFETGEYSGTDMFLDYESNHYAETGTIVLNASNRIPGRVSNSIAHECVHWYLHRKPFLLQKLLGRYLPEITCRKNSNNGVFAGNYDQVREWQASQLSPKILCPENSVVDTITNLYKKRRLTNPDEFELDSADQVLSFYATKWKISKLLLKIRLIEFGVEGLEGFFIFSKAIQGYVPSFRIGRKLGFKETFLVNEHQFDYLITNSPAFNSCVQNGKIVRIGELLCLNKPEFINSSGELTQKARWDFSEACIGIIPDGNDYIDLESAPFALSNPARAFTIAQERDCDLAIHFGKISSAQMSFLKEKNDDVDATLKKLNRSFPHDLEELLDWCDKTYEEVALDADLDRKSITHYLNGTRNPQIESVMQLCIAMQLPLSLALALLESAGHVLSNGKTHRAYYTILNDLKYCDLDTANQYLLSINQKPLGKTAKNALKAKN